MSARNSFAKRNEEIVNQFRYGKTISQLARAYGLSQSRISQIINRQKNIDNECETLRILRQTAFEIGCDAGLIRRAYNVLKRNGYTLKEPILPSDLLAIRGTGPATTSLIVEAQKRVVL